MPVLLPMSGRGFHRLRDHALGNLRSRHVGLPVIIPPPGKGKCGRCGYKLEGEGFLDADVAKAASKELGKYLSAGVEDGAKNLHQAKGPGSHQTSLLPKPLRDLFWGIRRPVGDIQDGWRD